ncbi:PfkB family carbohydrate kinase [Vallicoccus soli]|uniref:Carbohydrate kinase n=1 Tax=Vallicoccus soli TaxID=2339232 RepID=A0A3A3ZM40_9ACTN|nr:PfkB family carbohydrate kinase [Vallicoccus soli]RJK97591.1 carbohydrate kinase [Vallicoccus soli]
MSAAEVVVVGQVARDLVVRASRLPGPDGSAPARREWEGLGGKGANQAVACRRLGASAALVGVVGDDDAGARALRTAGRDGVDVSGVVVRPAAATALLLDVVEEDGTRRLLEDAPDEVLVRPEDVRASAGALAAARWVLLQLQTPADAAYAALEALGPAAPGAPCLLADGAPGDDGLREALLRRADVLRADAHEAELLVGRELPDVGAVEEAARELVAAGPRVVALGAGPEGNVVAWERGCLRIPLLDVDVVDKTGGGDSYVAALAVALLRGDPVEDAAWRASAAASLAVSVAGGRPRYDAAAVTDLVRDRRR